jgi:hypothetical protein
LVQATLSLQLYAVPAQLPPVHTSPLVQALPSLHAVPLLFDVQLLVLVAGVHCWHEFVGFNPPEA